MSDTCTFAHRPVVFERAGTVFASSRDVAAFFEKNHRDVLRDIDNLLKSLAAQNCAANMFIERREFHDRANREIRSFDMTRDGFTLLAMGFTGEKALGFKLRYIAAFNSMEKALNATPTIPEDRPPLLDMPTEDVRAWTRMISECRMLHGKRAARQLWAMSPLPQVEGEAAEADPTGDVPDLAAESCLFHLMSWRLPRLDVTVGELLRQNDSTAQAALRPFGVLPDPRGWTHWVAVARCHPSLSRCFHGTAWAGNWSEALLQLPEARRHPHAVWFGRMSKAVLLSRAVVDSAV